MLASGAHVKIGSIEYLLDEGVDPHYVHTIETILAPKQVIAGTEGKETVRVEKLLWAMDDWSGGEGARIFYTAEPSDYDYSTGLNGRIPGQLAPRPNRTQVQVTAMGDNTQRCYLAIAEGAVWIAGDEKIKRSTDYGDTWAAPAGAITITAGDNVSAVAGDDAYFYYATKSGADTREIRRINATDASAAVLARGNTNPAGHFIGMAIMGGRLYTWTGRKLFEFDIFETLPLTFNDTYRKVYDTGVELASGGFGGSSPGSWWADCVAGENAVYMFYGSEGQTHVYEYRRGAGRPLWKLPFGITGKSIRVQNGILYIAGHYGGEGSANGFGALWALPLDTLRPIFLKYPRRNQGTNLQLQEMANSYDNQILVSGAVSGRVWIYDAQYDGLSLLDDFGVDAPTNWDTNKKIGDMVTIGPRRLVAFYNPQGVSGATYEVLNYRNDEPDNRESDGSVSFQLDSAEWDYDYPHEIKGLLGFHVTFRVEDANTTSGLLANQRIVVAYSLDGGMFTTAGTVTSSTAAAGAQGRAYIRVSDGTTTRKFFRLRVRVTLDNNATTGVKPPILYGVTAESELLSYRETWDLVVRTKDETAKTRTSDLSRRGDVLRDNLEDLMENKNVVTFLDGYRERENNTTRSHTVVVEYLRDIIERNAEGSLLVRLRAVPS